MYNINHVQIYVTWNHELTYKEVTKPRYSSVYSFPLNHWATYLKRREILSHLDVLGWKKKSLDEVFKEVGKICESLSTFLGDKKYFFNDKYDNNQRYIYEIIIIHHNVLGQLN